MTAPGFIRPRRAKRKRNSSGLGGIFCPRGSVLGVPGGVPRGARFGGPGGPPGGPRGARARGGPDFGGPPLRTNCGGWSKLHRKIHFLVCTRARARAPRAPRKPPGTPKCRHFGLRSNPLRRQTPRERLDCRLTELKNKKKESKNKNRRINRTIHHDIKAY